MFASVIKSCGRNNCCVLLRHYSRFSCAIHLQKHQLKISKTNSELPSFISFKNILLSPLLSCSQLESQRYYAKKKKPSKQQVEEEEESDEEDEDLENSESDDIGSTNLITKTLPSLRIDSIIKNGLNISKKKVEKEFYACKIRLNGEKVLKKASNVRITDEIDLIKGYSPENQKFLVVDRIVIKGIGKVNQSGNFPVRMELWKELTIENYPDSWSKTDVLEDP